MRKNSQKQKVLNYLQSYKSITQLEAFNHFATFGLPKIISSLRKEGWKIITMRREGVNRFGDKVHFAEYILTEVK